MIKRLEKCRILIYSKMSDSILLNKSINPIGMVTNISSCEDMRGMD